MGLWQGKYLIVRRDGTSPHWNNKAFVLSPRDPHAQAALIAYAESMAADEKCDKAFAQSVLDLAESYDAYQKEHGLGNPTEQPWRIEAHDVMSALHGGVSVVVVMPDKDNKNTKPPRN